GLLQRAGAERYSIHELLRQFVAEKLAEFCIEPAAADAHTAYFSKLLASSEESLRGKDQIRTLSRLRDDAENIEAAWRRLVARGRFEDVASTLNAHARYMELANRWQEWADLLEGAIDRLRTAASDPDSNPARNHLILGKLLA